MKIVDKTKNFVKKHKKVIVGASIAIGAGCLGCIVGKKKYDVEFEKMTGIDLNTAFGVGSGTDKLSNYYTELSDTLKQIGVKDINEEVKVAILMQKK